MDEGLVVIEQGNKQVTCMRSNRAVIREDDPHLMYDAPPVHDNVRGGPNEERNMDLKMFSDQQVISRKSYCNLCGQELRRIYATTLANSQNLEIKTLTLKHTCDVGARAKYGEKATARILADLLKAKFANGKKGPRACELPDICLSELHMTISYTKAWNAKELAMAYARGNEEESYRFLSTYLHLLKSTNPGTMTAMHTTVDKKRKALFKYLFFALGACIAGYQYLRKVIVIDGTTMKGKYKGCLVAASGQDGNMQIFPLAFGVVDGENEGGWVWFFENLKRLATVVSKAARAYTIGDFRYWWREIENRRPACITYLTEIGLPHWTLSYFLGDRYNIMSSNISESLNAAMQTAVDYPIVSMVEFIRAMLMRWFYCRRTMANKMKTRCTPEVEEILIDHLKDAVDYRVLSASQWIYQVPCCHALAARGVLQIDIYTLVVECYFVGPWRKKYAEIIMPVPKERDSDIPAAVHEEAADPPKTKRGGGRPKKKRIPSQGEKHKGKKRKTPAKCGRCFGVGHNRKTCSQLI
ncbi:PREDICTED: uncharacterized protein LOC104728999 [Camelina sativa]|uniref:Uncharacterized protein LOC104728999 n=1 Tax=Camelina sativa TaxID=90675 RepID=A0ABM0UTQ4_CAMSA|nr:PREDICTED: uncharacterized protein LOC104728999 [Camelina sativa]